MRAKRLLAAAMLGGIVAAAGCKTCESCGSKADGVPAGYGGTVGSTLPASQGQSAWQAGGGSGVPSQMPPATGVGRPAAGGAGVGAYGGTSQTGGYTP